MDFYQWYAKREYREGDPLLTPEQETKWIRGFVSSTAWQSYRTGLPVHDGDCTKMPYTCNLCAIEDLLAEYREYALSERKMLNTSETNNGPQ